MSRFEVLRDTVAELDRLSALHERGEVRVLDAAVTPVLEAARNLVNAEPETRQTIVLSIDGRELARAVLTHALALAKEQGSVL